MAQRTRAVETMDHFLAWTPVAVAGKTVNLSGSRKRAYPIGRIIGLSQPERSMTQVGKIKTARTEDQFAGNSGKQRYAHDVLCWSSEGRLPCLALTLNALPPSHHKNCLVKTNACDNRRVSA